MLRKWYSWICALTTNYRRFKKYYCFEFTLSMETRLTIFQGGDFSPGLSAKYLLLILLLPRKWLPFSFWIATFSFFLNILYCFYVLPACWGDLFHLFCDGKVICSLSLSRKRPPIGQEEQSHSNSCLLNIFPRGRSAGVCLFWGPWGWFRYQNLDICKRGLASNSAEMKFKAGFEFEFERFQFQSFQFPQYKILGDKIVPY